MRDDPLFLVWDICGANTEGARRAEEVLRREGQLDAVLTVVVSTGGPANQIQTNVTHRVGDAFRTVEVFSLGTEGDSLRVVFCRRPDAERSWKDVMVRLLRAACAAAGGDATLVYRGNESRDWRHESAA